MSTSCSNHVPWDVARCEMQHGDLLLWRAGWGLADLLISRAGRTKYTHAGRAAVEQGEWRILDVVQWAGGRNVSLRDAVARAPGRIDVFEPNPGNMAAALGKTYDPDTAVRIMAEMVGCRYGWLNLFRVGLLELTIPRLLIRPDTGDNGTPWSEKHPPFCSQAQSIADAEAGCDPCPRIPHRLTTPGDLARSLFYRYRFTLKP